MAQYKVPQDVETEDKLLGPLTARQVIYLFIGVAFAGLAIGLINLLSTIGIFLAIPLFLIAIFMIILALPVKKDQSTDKYFISLIDFYFRKPQKRFWNPGQRESTIVITAPKVKEGPEIRNLTEDEASRRLSFLADIVDSEGYSVKNSWQNTSIRPEVATEAATTPDMYNSYQASRLSQQVAAETATHHADAVNQMRAAIKAADNITTANLPTLPSLSYQPQPSAPQTPLTTPAPAPLPPPTPAQSAAFTELSKNTEYSVATIAKEAERIRKSKDGEIYISLH